jgi:hypothetical protein
MSFIDVDQKRNIIVDDTTKALLYQVNTSVLRAVGIDSNLFVYDTLHGCFQHVAAVYDLVKFPTSQDVAAASGIDYYRQATVSVTFPTAKIAQAAANDHLRRLQFVVENYDSQPTNFPGETLVTLKGV